MSESCSLCKINKPIKKRQLTVHCKGKIVGYIMVSEVTYREIISDHILKEVYSDKERRKDHEDNHS